MHETAVLAHLPLRKKAKIIEIHGGRHMHHKMNVMGIREGQTIEIVSKQPFRGPLTIAIGNCKMTIGRGMAHKIFVDEL